MARSGFTPAPPAIRGETRSGRVAFRHIGQISADTGGICPNMTGWCQSATSSRGPASARI